MKLIKYLILILYYYTILHYTMSVFKSKITIVSDLSMAQINSRIQQEICRETLAALSDEQLLSEYKECTSVKNEITKLEDILGKRGVDSETRKGIINDYTLNLIPPGTKGVIRGNKFNKIVEKFIKKLGLCVERFDVCFEKTCDDHFTTEIPDWYIFEKKTNQIIIGMNQLDLWSGGHQLNRGSKYLIDNKHNNSNSKLLCVVCKEIQFSSKKNKSYQLFDTGFDNDTLCYLNNLKNIIYTYFNI